MAADAQTRRAVEAHPLWYHTIELAPDLVTRGWFDLRPVVDRMPWPDVRGKRCLDVGTYDGFLAFELERRGAAEVVAVDISDHASWDWPPHARAIGPEYLDAMAGAPKGTGFRIAHEALGSAVAYEEVNVYDLTPQRVGMFDVVVCGTLLLHLRDPLRALEAIRSVCGGLFVSAEQIRLGLTLRHRRRPMAELEGLKLCQWWIPNAAGHRRMVTAAGFEVVQATRPYMVRLGLGHPTPPRSARRVAQRMVQRIATGHVGVPTAAVLAAPRV